MKLFPAQHEPQGLDPSTKPTLLGILTPAVVLTQPKTNSETGREFPSQFQALSQDD